MQTLDLIIRIAGVSSLMLIISVTVPVIIWMLGCCYLGYRDWKESHKQ